MSSGPRRTPKMLTRREFLAAWCPKPQGVAQVDVAEPDIPGRFRLNALRYLPEAVLMRLVPVPREGWTVTVREDGVAYRDSAQHGGQVSLSVEGCAAAKLFDGTRTLKQVAQALEVHLKLPPSAGIGIVRETFLDLALCQVYQPARPPDGV